MKAFAFRVTETDKATHARTGIIHTPHGDIETPAFVPVGTQCAVKAVSSEDLNDLDVHLFFVNTYHAYLRPGIPIIKKAGGLHTFMKWDKPLITDSGGFQVFSLNRGRYPVPSGQSESPRLVRITDDGVTFQSHWDGGTHVFTPELSMQYQQDLGSDIHIAFDDCTPYGVTHKAAEQSMERTHRWAERSLSEHKRITCHVSRVTKPYQALYGSIQGSTFRDLRESSARFITSLPFDGYAVGGVAVGESKKEMADILSWVTPFLPAGKPRHLLGVGEIDDIFALVKEGFDTFDCVQPTRLARMGKLFLLPVNGHGKYGKSAEAPDFTIDITKKKYEKDFRGIDSSCSCSTCRSVSRAYLHHLFRVRELSAYRFATIHNIHSIMQLMGHIRESIQRHTFPGSFSAFLRTG